MVAALWAMASSAAAARVAEYSHATIWVGTGADAKEVQAAKEIQRYLYAISCTKLPIRTLEGGRTPEGAAIVVGTAHSLAGVARAFPANLAKLKTGTDEAFTLFTEDSGSPQAVILANEPMGALYGAYTFLEKFGIGFYLGGDVLPGTRVRLTLGKLDEFWSPKFPIRGSVIWYNFLNGPVCWNLEDYKYYFDQMVKMKANLVSFPEYGHGLTDYEVGGKLVPGGPFPTSENYGWGSFRGMKTSEFGFGTGEFFTGRAYGSKATIDARDDQDAVRRSQELFAKACAYAEQRGIKVCLGFQLDGMPDEKNLTDVKRRLEVLAKRYPSVHYVWFWQTEAGSIGWNGIPEGTRFDSYAKNFAYLKDDSRATEGGRMAAYISGAYAALKSVAPDKEAVISGWGGDKWDHFTDLFPGLDAVLPKDIVFSALDNIDPTWEPNVSQFYGKVSRDRRTWAIPWWESDGGGTRHDQFFPQCNTKPFSVLLPDVLHKGCQGVLGIHWRVRDVEDVARYMVDFAWKPDQTNYDGFWADFAARCFGPVDAAEGAKLLKELDALGPRWTGGAGQHECQPFTWVADKIWPKAENLAKLKEIRRAFAGMLERDRAAGRLQHTERLERLIAEIDWATLYDEAAPILENAFFTSDPKIVAHMMARAPLGDAMQAFTKLLITEGDWGILATVNVKAFAAYEKRWKEKAWTTPPNAAYQNDLPFQVAFKNPNCIVPAGETIPVRVVAVGGKAVKSVRLFYRALGTGVYKAVDMVRGFRNVYEAAIPASSVTESGVEYYIEVRSSSGEVVHLPKGLPSITATVVKG